MGFFENLKIKSEAKRLGFTLDEYNDYLEAEKFGISADEYRRWIKEFKKILTLEEYGAFCKALNVKGEFYIDYKPHITEPTALEYAKNHKRISLDMFLRYCDREHCYAEAGFGILGGSFQYDAYILYLDKNPITEINDDVCQDAEKFIIEYSKKYVREHSVIKDGVLKEYYGELYDLVCIPDEVHTIDENALNKPGNEDFKTYNLLFHNSFKSLGFSDYVSINDFTTFPYKEKRLQEAMWKYRLPDSMEYIADYDEFSFGSTLDTIIAPISLKGSKVLKGRKVKWVGEVKKAKTVATKEVKSNEAESNGTKDNAVAVSSKDDNVDNFYNFGLGSQTINIDDALAISIPNSFVFGKNIVHEFKNHFTNKMTSLTYDFVMAFNDNYAKLDGSGKSTLELEVLKGEPLADNNYDFSNKNTVDEILESKFSSTRGGNSKAKKVIGKKDLYIEFASGLRLFDSSEYDAVILNKNNYYMISIYFNYEGRKITQLKKATEESIVKSMLKTIKVLSEGEAEILEKEYAPVDVTAISLVEKTVKIQNNTKIVESKSSDIYNIDEKAKNVSADIKKRLDTFFTKLDSAYPDKIVKSLYKEHKKWGEALTKLYRELGYESGTALLEVYGYTVAVSDNKGGRTSGMTVDEVIAEFKSRYKDGPQYDNLKDLLAANEDLTSYCKKAQNNATELFGMSFAAYLVSIGVLKVKKSARNAQEPTIKERFDSLIEQLQEKYAGSEVLPKNILELKKQCSDLDVSHIESWALKSYGVSAEEYLREKGLLTENKKKDNCKEMSLKEARKLFRVSVEEDSVNITKYKGTDEHVEVPSHIDGTPVKGVKFDFCKEIKSVVLPDTVDSIWGHAFQNCSNLEKIVLPDTIKKIHGSAFSGCVKLKDINIPADVEYIGDYIFNDCDSLANENQMVIFGNIFYKYCGKEKEVSIPSGVKCIDGGAFYGNQVIEKVYIPDGVLRIGRMAFDGCSQLKEVRIPESIIEIGDYAFAGCKNIKKFNLPEGFENIGSNVFDGCDGLADDNGMIVFNNCLYKYLYSCNRIGVMRTLIIPEGITSIADYAFYFCQLIRKVVMPNTLKKIGKQAFYECSQLIDINISDSVKEIGAMAFAGCGYLANENGFVIINNTLYDSFSREKNIHIPDEVKEISTWAFYQSDYEAEHLETVVVPESVIKINTSAFAYCQKLQKVFLPDTLEEIQEKAFDCCPNVVLNVKKDSLAEKYATDNNMKFDILHD